MDSNLSLEIGFKGQQKCNAQAVPLQEGYLKLGGIVDSSETGGLAFGLVVSADPDAPELFKKGCATGDVVRGVCVFDDAIAQNAPGHPNSYLANMPCAAINHGFFWLESWKKTVTSAIDPVLGCKIVYNKTSGEIQFVAAATTVATGWAQLTNADVRTVDAHNGVLIYLD